MSLTYDNVSFIYPGSTAGVFDIALDIARGELVAVIGASGSGKSTILKLLAGFMQPDAGRILVEGQDVGPLAPEDRRLGVVFQNYALFPHMRLWENITYPLKVRGIRRAERRARAQEMLARVGMEGRGDDWPTAISGGQQQRVALARALIFEPRGLLLDEPLSALDAGLRTSMRDEIRRVQRAAGIATLLVTHDQEEALSIADRIVVMHDGRIIQTGTPQELYETPVNAQVAAFVGQSNLWPGTVEQTGRVRTPIGTLACPTEGYAPGAAVTVLVRPERILPAEPEQPPRVNDFRGTVVADRYLGPVRRIDLSVDGGLIRLETHARGAVGRVSIPAEAVRLLPGADAAGTRS
ncbi:ABC transporter ATP-binding protein [Pseudochelatococcus contaminans]|uniref:Putative spermidine/putrescine transport system ATP-binding protein n=1 Tax=Pseudochelatococcus contaminans TaxID=1538103 RepID=A0A7W6EGF2_9HYPH|nr:ABC transporter ATP-binding protein [Pseudochelatococcus contaminans]MBB3809375.1 putative spermidine/putrescine transport system ATP-binding protein [Pseudochelatococcus contaminans]